MCVEQLEDKIARVRQNCDPKVKEVHFEREGHQLRLD